MTRIFRQLAAEVWVPGYFSDIAIISQTMESLATEHGFTPERVVEDGLGWVSFIPLQLDDGRRFILEWYDHGKPEVTYVRADITDRPYSAALDKLLSALGSTAQPSSG